MNKMQLRYALSRYWLRRPLRWWQHRTINKQDVMLASYPRSGNTWLRFLLYECLTGKTADFISINDPRSPIADFPHFQQAPMIPPIQGRIIKTHESFRKEYGRGIYLVRDPRAVVVSEFYYLQGCGVYEGTLANFVESFVTGKVNGYGSWHKHVQSWLDAPIINLLMVRYEDLKQDGGSVLAQITKFLGFIMHVHELEQVVMHNSVPAMQQAEEAAAAAFRFVHDDARFIRQGKVHAWQTELTAAQVVLIERKMGAMMTQLGYDLVGSL